MADAQENNLVEPDPNPPQQEVTNEEIRNAALGRQTAKRQAFVPKPVEFLPLDLIKFVDELSIQERLTSVKASPALDALVLGSYNFPIVFHVSTQY